MLAKNRLSLKKHAICKESVARTIGGTPDYYYGYYGYPYDDASYDASPVYDYRYWYGLATADQTGLARRGYYHGPIDGVINSESREAIRAFQKAQGLPVTGLIDPPLLKALQLPAVPRVF